MRIAIGPWVWSTEDRDGRWSAPAGTIRAIDLRPTLDRSLKGTFGDHPNSIFIVDDGILLDLSYTILDLRNNILARDTWLALLGFRPSGTTFEEMLWSHLSAGDPAGLDRCRPFMPTSKGKLNLWMNGQLLRTDGFRYGSHQHTAAVRTMVRRQIREWFEFETATRDNINLTRRILDYELDKYRIPKDQWEELVPTDLRAEIDGPLTRETTLSESWNCADGTTINCDLTWTKVRGSWQLVSNRLKSFVNLSQANGSCRAEHDLSGTDMEGAVDVEWENTLSLDHGLALRYASAAETYYWLAGNSNLGERRIAAMVAGTLTDIAVQSQTINSGEVFAVLGEVDGSDLFVSVDGSSHATTDTGITSGVRGGVVAGGNSNTRRGFFDNWTISDVSTGADTVAPDDSHHGHHSTQVTILTLEAVQPDDSWHAQHSTQATVSQEQSVAPDDAWHAQWSTEATLQQAGIVAPDASWHAQWSDEATLLQAGSVAPDDAWHAHYSSEAGVVAGAVVSPDDSWHVHTSDEATIAQAGTVSPDDSWHAQSSTEVTVLGGVAVAPDDSWHGHTSTESGVTTVLFVSPDDSWHQQWADEVTVSQDVPGPIVVPNVAWQHWGPILLMMDEGGSSPVAVGLSIRFHGAVVLQHINANAVVLQTTRARSLVL